MNSSGLIPNLVQSLALAVMALLPSPAWSATDEPLARIDHIILGAADLDEAVQAFERVTGIRPVYGGKHPTGTHNAIVSLGGRTYLEIIALQPGASRPTWLPDLSGLRDATPIGWSVGASDEVALRDALGSAGFELTNPEVGSRLTPSGSTLRWQSFDLKRQLEGAPFFILWAPGAPHPSTTSPAGCTLKRLSIAGPESAGLRHLGETLHLLVTTSESKTLAFSLELTCPKGLVSFQSVKRKSRPDA